MRLNVTKQQHTVDVRLCFAVFTALSQVVLKERSFTWHVCRVLTIFVVVKSLHINGRIRLLLNTQQSSLPYITRKPCYPKETVQCSMVLPTPDNC